MHHQRIQKVTTPLLIGFVITLLAKSLHADDGAELAKQLANPIAALISVPLQLNYDQNIGATDEGERWTWNIQPVIPIELNDEWNIISRTIVPLISQDDVSGIDQSESGIGDIIQSLFFSPKAPSYSGWIWGVGPVLLLPTGSNTRLTGDKWGIGPTAVALKQQNGWTYGALINHIWSVAGDIARNDISTSFLQPFLSYTTKDAWTYTINTESTYDWKSTQWSVPFNAVVTKVTQIGDQLVSVGGGFKYWADGPAGAPEGFGVRLIVTLLYPK